MFLNRRLPCSIGVLTALYLFGNAVIASSQDMYKPILFILI